MAAKVICDECLNEALITQRGSLTGDWITVASYNGNGVVKTFCSQDCASTYLTVAAWCKKAEAMGEKHHLRSA